MQLPIKIRTIRQSDHAFIFDSWFQTVRPLYKFVPKPMFTSAVKAQIEQALERCEKSHGGAVVCDEKNDDQIFAFQVVSTPLPDVLCIDFAYTKSFYWRMGLQKMLLQSHKEKNVVATLIAPSFTNKEFASKDGVLLGDVIKGRFGIIIDPFFYERLKKGDK